jgi:hypothetical protein
LNLSVAALVAVLAASVLTPTALVFCDSAAGQMNQLNSQFSDVMNGTMGFLDHAWGVAQEFQNSSYHYDPSELGNYTVSTP